MKLDVENLKTIANLANLKIEENEIEQNLKDFNEILKYVEEINQIDVKDIKEEDIYFNKEFKLREDKIQPSLDKSEFGKFAPDFQNGYFIVPKVIET